MFGDKNIFGNGTMFVDDKNRIILPKFTHREVGDRLVIVKNDESNSYDVYREDKYSEKLKLQIDYLEDKLNKTTDSKKREELQILLNALYSHVLASVKCTYQGRIVITSILEKDEKLDHVEVIGAYDHLMIKKPKQKSKKK